MFNLIRKIFVKYKCNKYGFYCGRYARIQRVGYPDHPMWGLAIYNCRSLNQAVRLYVSLDKTIEKLLRIRGDNESV